MPTIPSGTKFMGVNPDVNTDERRSSLSNSYQEFYTIDEIVAEASAADTNIYNSDGTLDANRTVDLDGNTINFNDGKVGVNVTPGFPLQVRGTAVPSAGETVARFDVSDSSAYLSVVNGTAANGAFAPMIQGRQVGTSTQPALQTEGIIDVADDTGTAPVTLFKTRLTGLLQVVTRPVFQFSNWTLDIMTMLANGNVGIGTTNPQSPLHVETTAVPSTNESIARFTVSDAAGAEIKIINASSVDGRFVPEISALQGLNTDTAFKQTSIIDPTQDSGTNPVTVFVTALGTIATAIVTRPLYQFRNAANSLLTILANGNVGIGTTTPTEKLEVNGKTKTTTFQMTTTPTAGYVLTSDASGNGTWTAAGGGGLTEFTEAANSSAPNATVPVNSLTATGAATNIDAAIVPKGTGAFTLQVADNTTAGGNKRGTRAVDLQMERSNANQVASGQWSFVVGKNNRASTDYANALGVENIATGSLGSFACGYLSSATGSNSTAHGYLNTASGSNSSVAIGYTNTASGTSSVALGRSNQASGSQSIAMGNTNIANADNSMATGYYSHTFGVRGRWVTGQLNTTNGDCQKSIFCLSIRTTGNTATTLVSGFGAGAPSATNQVILSNQAAYGFTGTIVGKQSGSTNAVMWKVEGLIARGANAASTVLTTSTVTLVSNAPAWGTPTLVADTTNGGLQVQVIGAAATNIQWTAVIDTTEVIYA